MTVTAALSAGRRARLLLMRDTVTITRTTGKVFSAVTGSYVDTITTVYTGPADVKPRDVEARDSQAGERQVVQRGFDVALPFTTTAQFLPDDQLRIDASEDTTLAGRVLTVTSVGHGARRTAHHLAAEDRA
jgi:hypothetical protein